LNALAQGGHVVSRTDSGGWGWGGGGGGLGGVIWRIPQKKVLVPEGGARFSGEGLKFSKSPEGSGAGGGYNRINTLLLLSAKLRKYGRGEGRSNRKTGFNPLCRAKPQQKSKGLGHVDRF